MYSLSFDQMIKFFFIRPHFCAAWNFCTENESNFFFVQTCDMWEYSRKNVYVCEKNFRTEQSFFMYVRHTEEISANANITHVCFFIQYRTIVSYFSFFLSSAAKKSKILLLPASFRHAKEIKAKRTQTEKIKVDFNDLQIGSSSVDLIRQTRKFFE